MLGSVSMNFINTNAQMKIFPSDQMLQPVLKGSLVSFSSCNFTFVLSFIPISFSLTKMQIPTYSLNSSKY